MLLLLPAVGWRQAEPGQCCSAFLLTQANSGLLHLVANLDNHEGALLGHAIGLRGQRKKPQTSSSMTSVDAGAGGGICLVKCLQEVDVRHTMQLITTVCGNWPSSSSCCLPSFSTWMLHLVLVELVLLVVLLRLAAAGGVIGLIA
jgi:hypothetical protein